MIHTLTTFIPFFSRLLILGLSCLISISIVSFRIYLTGKTSYYFLIWNLFLAVIPVLVAVAAYKHYEIRKRRIDPLFFLLALLWFAFFPNAPYIITDFLHLKPRHNIPLWYDTLMLYSFAWNGLIAGFFSLRIMHLIVADRLGKMTGWLFILAVSPMTAAGIYLGRFLRWNSWDIIQNPFPLLSDILRHFSDPATSPRKTGLILLLAILIFFGYALLISFSSITIESGEKNGRNDS